MILRKTVLAAGALAALLVSASVGSAKPTATAKPGAAAPAQCSTKLLTLRPHYPDPVKPLAGAASSLSGAGSTFVAPIMSMWAQAYSKKGTNVAYQAIGSGGGVSQINAQTVDFGASDTPMLDTELAASKGGPILHIPLVLGAVTVAYNVKGVGQGLNFDGPTIGKIYAGQITKWNDPAIKKLNPKANLPDQAIAVVHRSDGSGTTAVFTDFLTKTSPEWVAKLGGADKSFGKTVAWPVGIGGKGNDGVAALVEPDRGRDRLSRAAVRDLEQADLRQRQEQEGHVHHAVRRDDERGRPQDVLPAGPAHQPDVARRGARVPDHGHRVRARRSAAEGCRQGEGARQLPLVGADDGTELPGYG